MPTDKPWEMDPIEEDAAPWNADAEVGQPSKPLSMWEKLQQAATGGLFHAGEAIKGAVKESPLILQRTAALPGQVLSGAMETAADVTGLSKSPTISRGLIDRARKEYELRRKLEAPFEAGPEASTGEKVGRGLARTAPAAILAGMTGGASLPVQAAVQGGAQALQATSEGATPTESGFAGALAGLAPVGGRGVNAILSKVRGPLTKWVDTGAMEAAQRLKSVELPGGIELPAGAASTSRLPALAEAISSKGIFGGKVAQRGAKAETDLVAAGNDLVRRAGSADPSFAGQQIGHGLERFEKTWEAAKNAAYDEASARGFSIDPEGTVGVIDSMLEGGGLTSRAASLLKQARNAIAPKQATEGIGAEIAKIAAKDPNMAATMAAQLEKEGVAAASVVPRDATTIQQWIKNLSAAGGGRDPAFGDPRVFQKVAATLRDELHSKLPEDIAAKLAQADAIYGQGKDALESVFGKKITDLAAQGHFDKITTAIFNTKMSSLDVPRIFETIGPEASDTIRANVLADILRKATNASEGKIRPTALWNQLKQYGPKLKEILTEEQYSTLRDMASVAEALSRSGAITGGSQTAFLGRIGAYPAMAVYNPLLAAKVLMGDAVFNAFIGSSGGQRWLTTGLGKAVLPGRFAQAGSVGLARGSLEYEMAKRRKKIDDALRGAP